MPICRRRNITGKRTAKAVALGTVASLSHAWVLPSSPHSSNAGGALAAYPLCSLSPGTGRSVDREFTSKSYMTRSRTSNEVTVRESGYPNNTTIEDFIGREPSNVDDLSLRPSNNRIGGRRRSLSSGDTIADTMQSTSSNADIARTLLGITAATVLSVFLVDDITMRFETVQEWRYAWPLIGTLYVASGLSFLLSDSGEYGKNKEHGRSNIIADAAHEISSFVPLASNRIVYGLAALAGVGVLVGGFIDAFFPVWYTSPDLLGTRAGIEADSAAILFILTVAGIVRNISDYCWDSGDVGEVEDVGSMHAVGSNLTSRKAQLPSWALAVVLCTQLWEIASPTFYSWGELLGIVS